MTGTGRRCIEEILRRKTPDGYYLLPCRQATINILKDLDGIQVVDVGDKVVVLVKSRSLARRLASRLLARDLLEC